MKLSCSRHVSSGAIVNTSVAGWKECGEHGLLFPGHLMAKKEPAMSFPTMQLPIALWERTLQVLFLHYQLRIQFVEGTNEHWIPKFCDGVCCPAPLIQLSDGLVFVMQVASFLASQSWLCFGSWSSWSHTDMLGWGVSAHHGDIFLAAPQNTRFMLWKLLQLNFVKFTSLMANNLPKTQREAAFELVVLMEIPFQYKGTVELGISK
ncbi:hypothetical protein GOP47_0028607 [Adiantum capillus-veneris]|nr:hypothetical protein GOP47_0028607 [Adiantum capillus-veneris]